MTDDQDRRSEDCRPEKADNEMDYDASPLGAPEATGAVQLTSAEATQGRYTLEVRFGVLAQVGRATSATAEIAPGSAVILRTGRGTEFGVSIGKPVPVNGDLGETVAHVLRLADEKDIELQRRIEEEIEPEEKSFCREKIRARSLMMKLSAVEHLFGNERLVFYFTSERRVDFRALVRDLAYHFRTRVDLRQIGARDEAKLLADFEHCGQPLCCKVFLKNLEPVTMRMAKLQRTSLDPAKISGRCGRLMCCLRYEDEVYKELKKGLPKRGTKVVAEGQNAEVLSTDILAQRALVRTGTGDLLRVPVAELARPVEGSPPPRPSSPVPAEPRSVSKTQRDVRNDRKPAAEPQKITEARPKAEAVQPQPMGNGRKRGSRRRRRGKRPSPPQGGGADGATPA